MKFSAKEAKSKSTKKVVAKKASPKKQVNSSKEFISWFEIPAINIVRSSEFYGYIFSIGMEIKEVNGYSMAFFPADKGIGGAIVSGEGSFPSDKGILIYLNAGSEIDLILSKIEPAGGRIILPKTLINEENGYFALFLDTEGNKMALHSNH